MFHQFNLSQDDEITIRDICTPIFIPALFIKAKIWKQPKCPSVNEWILKNIFYTHTQKQKNIIWSHKKNKTLPLVITLKALC